MKEESTSLLVVKYFSFNNMRVNSMPWVYQSNHDKLQQSLLLPIEKVGLV